MAEMTDDELKGKVYKILTRFEQSRLFQYEAVAQILALCAPHYRREVVEWVDGHSVGITSDNELKANPLWQAKLKEWGLKEKMPC